MSSRLAKRLDDFKRQGEPVGISLDESNFGSEELSVEFSPLGIGLGACLISVPWSSIVK